MMTTHLRTDDVTAIESEVVVELSGVRKQNQGTLFYGPHRSTQSIQQKGRPRAAFLLPRNLILLDHFNDAMAAGVN
jgi:hypothetical protein